MDKKSEMIIDESNLPKGQDLEQKHQEIKARLELSKKLREEQLAARKEEEREHKNEDEDYTTIDKKFNEIHDSLEIELVKWNDFKDDKTAIAEHFEKMFKTYSELRDYVNNYTFAIPSTFFSLYQ